MTPQAITAIFTGLTGLIAAMAAWTASRSRRTALDQRVLRRRVRQLERQTLSLVEHLFVLELEIARRGGRVPDRPLILEQLHADDADEEDAPPRRSDTGRHSLRPDRPGA